MNHFPPKSGGIACSVAELNATQLTSTPERRNGNINLNKYLIFSRGNRTHNQSRLQSHFVPLHHDWPHQILMFSFIKLLYKQFSDMYFFIFKNKLLPTYQLQETLTLYLIAYILIYHLKII